ncbi:MAG: hypothetical protein SGPRY_000262 [Prymnesium sp.]
MEAHFVCKRPRAEPPARPGEGLSIKLELFESGIFNATCEKNAGIRECILKPLGFKWVPGIGAWQHTGGNARVLQSFQDACLRDGLALTIVDRSSAPLPRYSLTKLLKAEDLPVDNIMQTPPRRTLKRTSALLDDDPDFERALANTDERFLSPMPRVDQSTCSSASNRFDDHELDLALSTLDEQAIVGQSYGTPLMHTPERNVLHSAHSPSSAVVTASSTSTQEDCLEYSAPDFAQPEAPSPRSTSSR